MKQKHEFEIIFRTPAGNMKSHLEAYDVQHAESKFMGNYGIGSTNIISIKKTCKMTGKGHVRCAKCGGKL